MDEYIAFIEASLKDINPALAARQKSIEKRIARPFAIPPAVEPPAHLERFKS